MIIGNFELRNLFSERKQTHFITLTPKKYIKKQIFARRNYFSCFILIWASRFVACFASSSRRAIRSITFAPSASLRSPCRYGGSATIPLAQYVKNT
jgi:hypothetical protein